jgi:hypothetical protein
VLTAEPETAANFSRIGCSSGTCTHDDRQGSKAPVRHESLEHTANVVVCRVWVRLSRFDRMRPRAKDWEALAGRGVGDRSPIAGWQGAWMLYP